MSFKRNQNDVDYSPTPINNKQKKKRKQRDFDTKASTSIQSPKKRQKRSSKKGPIPTPSAPNSHVTITFANINGTIDAIILPKQNVIAISDDVLLENKGKLSIKTSDPIQNEITPQIPIDIKILKIPNVKTIHPRNSFRMGTSLFYCMVSLSLSPCVISLHTTNKRTNNRMKNVCFGHFLSEIREECPVNIIAAQSQRS